MYCLIFFFSHFKILQVISQIYYKHKEEEEEEEKYITSITIYKTNL